MSFWHAGEYRVRTLDAVICGMRGRYDRGELATQSTLAKLVRRQRSFEPGLWRRFGRRASVYVLYGYAQHVQMGS